MNRTWKFIIVILAITLIALPATAQKGGDPYHPHNNECVSAPWIVVANGYSDADVAVAGTLVSRTDGFADMVFVGEDTVPGATQTFLERKFQDNEGSYGLYVVGGKNAVSEGVVTELEEFGRFHTVRRVDGDDRAETAAIANHVDDGTCK